MPISKDPEKRAKQLASLVSWRPGQSGNPGGRRTTPKTLIAAALAKELKTKPPTAKDIVTFARSATLENPEWRESAIRRMIAGRASHLEQMLLVYGYGKPLESTEAPAQTSERNLANASDSELEALRQAALLASEIRARAAGLPAADTQDAEILSLPPSRRDPAVIEGQPTEARKDDDDAT